MIDGIYDMCIICGYNMIYNNGIAKYDNFFVGRVFADFAGFQGIVSPINGGDIYRWFIVGNMVIICNYMIWVCWGVRGI